MAAAFDNREAILTRLLAVLKSVAGADNAYRNQISVPEKKVKDGALILLDADEEPEESAYGRKRPATTPVIVVMTPEVHLLVQKNADDIGPALNTLRRKVIRAVLHDETLVALCHDGDLRYAGFATGFAAGRTIEGIAGISFAFRYVLRPDLIPA